MTPQEFVAKWDPSTLSERSGSHEHFLDLCKLVGHETPAEADPDGAWFTFERGLRKMDGQNGWADVWKRGYFAWEYKGKHKDLRAAYAQLQLYRVHLENPPLLVVCDMDRFEIYTNFTNTVEKCHAFDLTSLTQAENLEILRKVFFDPEGLKPGQSPDSVTRQAAEQFGQLADKLRVRKVDPQRAAHFLMKLMFCMFAEDIGLLPSKVFSRSLTAAKKDAQRLAATLASLFQAMSRGGMFGPDEILYFNGGLFADADVIELRPDEIEQLVIVAGYDWSSVEPSIFGTLFERTLDPAKRAQIGAHYTSREDILTIVEPVVMTPLRRHWREVQAACDELWDKLKTAKTAKGTRTTRRKQLERKLLDFLEELAHVRVLDPACGSGNFLYVSIHLLLDLQKEVIAYGAMRGVSLLPQVRPTQLAGIEVNPYAQALASVVIWIGYLQWMQRNGFSAPRHPVLEPIESILLMDAILDLSDPQHPKEPPWPEADFIVGNPPFLGGKRLRTELGDSYVQAMFDVFDGRVPRECDLVAYWFEKARASVQNHHAKRAGLIATQAIRAGANRHILDRIKESGDIFMAWSDRPWVLDGADVRVSLIGFDDGQEKTRLLDGSTVDTIHVNLSASVDTTRARPLATNLRRCFMGVTKGGAFDIGESLAIQMLTLPCNPNRRPNSDVVRPWLNASDVVRAPRREWLIDFGAGRPMTDAAWYERPFEYVAVNVRPEREKNNRQSYRELWWLHVEPRPALRAALESLPRYLATPRVAKHRIFVWCQPEIIPDSRLYAFACAEDYEFGVLHSRPHEVWALATSSRHGVGNDPTYNNSTCFETFPFPEPTEAQRAAIAEAARELDRLRSNWLNPPEWTRTEVLEFPGSLGGPWQRYLDPATVGERDIGTVRYPRLVPADEPCAKKLKKRTLTNLYNERPMWLQLAHRRLDEAVFAAYGWAPSLSDDDLLAALLALNLQRAAANTPA